MADGQWKWCRTLGSGLGTNRVNREVTWDVLDLLQLKLIDGCGSLGTELCFSERVLHAADC